LPHRQNAKATLFGGDAWFNQKRHGGATGDAFDEMKVV
jgi:hypothetical protein